MMIPVPSARSQQSLLTLLFANKLVKDIVVVVGVVID